MGPACVCLRTFTQDLPTPWERVLLPLEKVRLRGSERLGGLPTDAQQCAGSEPRPVTELHTLSSMPSTWPLDEAEPSPDQGHGQQSPLDPEEIAKVVTCFHDQLTH